MLATTIVAHNTRFKFGWIALLVSAALMSLTHFSLIFILDEPVLFTGFAALQPVRAAGHLYSIPAWSKMGLDGDLAPADWSGPPGRPRP